MKSLIAATLVGLAIVLALTLHHSASLSGNRLVLVPGATNPAVTQANIHSTICVTGWTATIRPPASYTTALKLKQMKQFGFKGTAKDYEEDHLISLELGGNPTDPQNLWPEAYAPTPGAHEKDQVENYLKRSVCNGTITLAEAQHEIATNWLAVYQTLQGKLGATGDQSDNDDEPAS